MGERTSYAEGTFSWAESSTGDTESAKAFYTGLFGWETQDNPVPGGGVYTIAALGGRAVAAISAQRDEEREAGVPPHWNNYVTVADADASTARVKELGGNVMLEPFDVMDAGRMSVVADPAGAVLMLWQAKEMIGAELVNDVGALCWNELATSDTEGAKSFYSGLFGWEWEDFGEGDQRYSIFSLGKTRDGGMRGLSPEEQSGGVPPNWMPYFHAESTDDAVAQVNGSGGQTMFGPMDVPVEGGGRIAVVADPAGAPFGLFEGETDP